VQSPLALDLRAATSATLAFESWLTTAGAWGEVQVRGEDGEWKTLRVITSADDWTAVVVDLDDYLGQVVDVRFVFYPAVGADRWRRSDLGIDVSRRIR